MQSYVPTQVERGSYHINSLWFILLEQPQLSFIVLVINFDIQSTERTVGASGGGCRRL